MKNINNSCRVCFKKKLDSISIYELWKQVYLPHIIYNISGVKILKRDEPSALICGLCAKACLVAHKIILRCQETDECLNYVEKFKENKNNMFNTNEEPREFEQLEYQIELLDEEEQEMINMEYLKNEGILLNERKLNSSTDDESPEQSATFKKYTRVQTIKRRRSSVTKQTFFECEFCDFRTSVGRQLVDHKSKEHQITDTKIYACKFCPQRFSWRPTLHRHIEIDHKKMPEEKKYICNICGKGYLQDKHLQCHIKESHGPRLYKCVEPDCNQSFTRAFTLRRHFLAAHSNTAKYHCAECNKSFKIYDLWKYHSDVVHKFHKVYCPRCGYGFRNKEKLEEHLANDVCKNCIIPCNYCQRKFTTTSGLLGHMKNIHKF